MSTPETTEDGLGDVFRAIADPTRRLILDQLRVEPMNTTALCAHNDGMTRAGVINHIKILEAAELIRVEQRGRERINHLNAARLQMVYDRWLTPFEQIWTARLGDLTRAAEESAATPTAPSPTQKEAAMATDPPPVRVVEITQTQTCAATAEVVWVTLTDEVEKWWSRDFLGETNSGLTLQLEPGGTLWDARGNDGGYALATVRGFTRDRELILDGEFGVPGAMHGRLVVELDESGDGTTSVTFTNRAIGAIPDDLAGNREGWALLLRQLCSQAES